MGELPSGEGGGGGGGYYEILRDSLVGSYVMSGRFFMKPGLSNQCINTTFTSKTR